MKRPIFLLIMLVLFVGCASLTPSKGPSQSPALREIQFRLTKNGETLHLQNGQWTGIKTNDFGKVLKQEAKGAGTYSLPMPERKEPQKDGSVIMKLPSTLGVDYSEREKNFSYFYGMATKKFYSYDKEGFRELMNRYETIVRKIGLHPVQINIWKREIPFHIAWKFYFDIRDHLLKQHRDSIDEIMFYFPFITTVVKDDCTVRLWKKNGEVVLPRISLVLHVDQDVEFKRVNDFLYFCEGIGIRNIKVGNQELGYISYRSPVDEIVLHDPGKAVFSHD